MKQTVDNLNTDYLGKKMNDSCLVLEGGGLRGTFTCGVLEYFLENQIDFDRVVGVSAGACNGASYVSRQIGRNWKVNVEVPSDKRFMGLKHLFTKGSYFNFDFIFDEVPHRLIPFDNETFYQNQCQFDINATSLSTGESVVFSKNEMSKIGLNLALRASSSIPLISKPVAINGVYFLDGGVADPIPVKYALERHEKAVVILTRPRGYRKEKTSNSILLKLAFGKSHAFLSAILKQNEVYNEAIDYCNTMERDGRLFIIAPLPEFMIKRTEHRFEKRAGFYNHGYSMAKNEMEKLLQFLKE
jgi:predicted patatin/cPLA2 family phospholipase